MKDSNYTRLNWFDWPGSTDTNGVTINGRYLTGLSNNRPKSRNCRFVDVSAEEAAALINMLYKWNHIESIEFVELQWLNSVILRPLLSLPNLSWLGFLGCSQVPVGGHWDMLPELSIATLSMAFCYNLVDSDLLPIARMKSLKKLCLSGCELLTAKGIYKLTHCNLLSTIELPNFLTVDATLASGLLSKNSLTAIRFGYGSKCSAIMSVVAESQSLKYLVFGGNNGLNETDYLHLASHTEYLGIADSDLAADSKLRNLEEFNNITIF